MAVDWTQLPRELLQSISEKLTLYSDYVRYRAVCPQWRSSVPRFPRHLPPQFPWLMLPLSETQLKSHRSFYDLSTDKTYHLELPDASRSKLRVYSTNGWLIILDNSSAVILLNPLTLAKFHLPPLSSFPNVSLNYSKVGKEYTIRDESGNIYHHSLGRMRDFFIKKFTLSSGSILNMEDNFIAVAILNETGKLVYCKNNDQSWTSMGDVGFSCWDVTYYKGKFYAVDDQLGSIAVCDVNGESPSVSVIRMCFSPVMIGFPFNVVYLVNSGDELLAVVRQHFLTPVITSHGPSFFHMRTRSFAVYKMNWSEPQWIEVEDLGDRSLFVMENSSVSLSTVDVQGCLWSTRYECLKNCIFFTDDYDCKYNSLIYRDDDGAFDWDRGIYKLRGDQRIISLPFRTRDPYALWVTPTL